MFEENSNAQDSGRLRSTTARNLLAIGFRQQRLLLGTFLGIFFLGALVTILLPKEYVSDMKILVKHERADPMVTPGTNAPTQLLTGVTEEELESEAELLKARDLLTQVVLACNLQTSSKYSWWNPFEQSEAGDVSRAVVKLNKDLNVQPVKLTNLISVSYTSDDPQSAAKVLNTLASLYIEKHLAINHVPGEFAFFHQQAEEFRKTLANSEQKLVDFGRETGVVDPVLQKDLTVRRLAELEADAKQAEAQVTENKQRIRSLEAQLAALPERQTTQVRRSDNPQLMERLKSTLLDLEIKRTDLLSKYSPSYRPVQDVESQIADARKAIANAESAPLRDETTDRDPTYEALAQDLAKSKADLAATQARASATAVLVNVYKKQSQQLDDQGVLQQEMLRKVKADEANLMLYSQKQEEARISDALDRERISNVVVAVPPSVPFKPKSRWALALVLTTLLAGALSVSLALVVDHWDPSFRTPEEVESLLGIPVVAAFPRSGD
jgi:uncharacterized protein involved in exopolysaccharide biosynthesis